MPVNNTVRFAHAVVAVCDDQDGRVAMNSVDLGKSFKFHATYTPSATVLFKLTIALTKEVTLYLQFTPSVISSMEKTSCDEQDENRPRGFDIIQRHLDGHRSFTRLRFRLRSRGQLIVPVGFDHNHCNDQTRHTLALIASLAATSTFSLYMPHNVLPKPKYDVFLDAYTHSSAMIQYQHVELERMMDLRKMYNGKGGKLYTIEDQNRLLSLMPGVVVPTVTNDHPPSYERPPDYNIEEQSSLLPPSQQSTASESDNATVAAPTPPGYRRNNEGPWPEKPSDAKRHHSKHGWSSEGDGSNDSGNAKRYRHRKRRAMDASLHSEISSVGLGRVEGMIEALETRFQEQIEQLKSEVRVGKSKEIEQLGRIETLEAQGENQQAKIEQLRVQVKQQQEEIGMLRNGHEDLVESHYEIERRQDEMEDTLNSVEAQVDGAVRDCEDLKGLPENVEDMVEVLAKDIMVPMVEAYMDGKAEDVAVNIGNIVKEKLRRALDDQVSLMLSFACNAVLSTKTQDPTNIYSQN
ncbi:hypothetical protein PG993_010789 [Apiospora rasikravindrae]|uniref:Uncharacterized protein n=1 Tax=Apiospora rasikravindrae TaxID=990691 RepID=A0ABR1SCE5_9PEZI